MNGRRSFGLRGFTLVEVILFVGVLAVMASTGMVVLVSTREAAKENKLGADTAHVNEVLQIYMANGGTLPATYNSGTMMAMLKTRADANSAAKTMGLTGSYLDVRTTAVEQTAEEAATTQLRAVWTGSGYIVKQGPGPIGIKEFNLQDSLAAAAPTTNSRDPGVLGVDTNKQWIWDYTDKDPTGVVSGTTPGTADRPGYTAGTASAAASLSAPIVPSGTFPLINFNPSYYVTIADGSNPSNVSQLYYATSTGGGFALYSGSFAVTPGTTVSAYDKSTDPSRYTDSVVASGTISAAPVTLQLGFVSAAPTPLTYALLGGAMSNGTATAPTATITLANAASIPAAYTVSSKFQAMYGYGSGSPSTSGPAFSGAFSPLSVSLDLANWGSATTLTVTARLVSSDSSLISSTTGTLAFTGTTTALAAPTISPVTGAIAAPVPVTITPASGVVPVGARTYYTVDGSDPGANSATGEPTSSTVTLYSGSFTPVAGSNGSIDIRARTYGPASYGQWFTPSTMAEAVYTTSSFPDGALVGSANLNGTFVGSLIYAAPTSGNMNSIQFNSGAQILNGNLYVPGQPTVRLTNGTVWSGSTDSAFSAFIEGYEFDASGNKTVQTTPRVLDETGSITPNNYTITFNKNAILEGKVIRRHTAPAFPVIAAPPSPDSSGSISLNSHPSAPLSSTTYANITNNTSAVGDVSLNAGHYGNLIANNGTSFVLGDPLNPDVTQVYSFQSLTLNSGASLKIVGKVIVTVAGSINLSSGSVMGNSSHSDWLQLQMSSSGAQFNANSSSSVYAELVDPTGSVTFNSGSVFHGSVTALSLTINSQGVVFDQPPVIQN